MRFLSNVIWVAACWLVVLLAGCANPQNAPATPGNRNDIITESDESDTRRRARLRLELATGYFEQGQTNVALDEIKQSLATDPTFAEAYNLRGLVYMRLNDMPMAEDSFRRALALNPRDADVAHNYGWLMCQQGRYADSARFFAQAVANPTYGGTAKTLMTQGVCQVRAGQRAEAEQSFMHSYELDAGNPVTGYNLANLLYERGDFTRAQFYIRRLNNSDLANAETLWLGIKTEQKLNNRDTVRQLGDQLKKRFAASREAASYEKGAFNE
ncbi:MULTISPECIES: type IV pilus biogenesis/stability protein PilW [unclassified Polaromonas]|uniref:type IV pilus biogenesis/stability protein PilW n=1 Tax=unclassified Polaromonas TaxID=2638319 RepID=UPI000F08EC4E|nr:MULTISPECIES: type IV pilus biogenesis/stability protein PilW [unclassified Polaromonas]AYQ29750.1 type IV pilus biogenesis/stability protein PilW [Polaromonas sp. SP1]QGJ19134.1 type IV pilus biogenesis/stability protein PilW [Polaromonas sp. Pch-P]